MNVPSAPVTGIRSGDAGQTFDPAVGSLRQDAVILEGTMVRRSSLIAVVVLVLGGYRVGADDSPPSVVTQRRITVVSTCYEVQTSLLPAIGDEVKRVRAELRSWRGPEKFVGYLSTPIGDNGVGYTPLNIEIAKFVTAADEASHKGSVRILNPGTIHLPLEARSADYMYLWTQVLAGEDGFGDDFDFVVMTGPSDVAAFFSRFDKKLDGSNLSAIDHWIESRVAEDEVFRRMTTDAERLRLFRAYYALGLSAALSPGAHDEWNIFMNVNEKRRLRDGNPARQLPIYFDGRLLTTSDLEARVSPGTVCH